MPEQERGLVRRLAKGFAAGASNTLSPSQARALGKPELAGLPVNLATTLLNQRQAQPGGGEEFITITDELLKESPSLGKLGIKPGDQRKLTQISTILNRDRSEKVRRDFQAAMRDAKTFSQALSDVNKDFDASFLSPVEKMQRVIDRVNLIKAGQVGQEDGEPKKFKTKDEVREAVQSGALSIEEGAKILQEQFDMEP